MQCTIPADAKELAVSLTERLGGEFEPGRGMLGYAGSFVVSRRHETLAKVLHSGMDGGDPHVVVTGAASDELVPVLRDGWPVHRVTRMDSAQDFSDDAEGAFRWASGFDYVREVLLKIAGTKHQVQEMSSVKNGHLSRTVYIGAPASRVRVRLYEKGQFERQKGNEDADGGWYRLEAQIRPTGHPARDRAASLDATEAWGQSPLLRTLAQEVMGLDVQPVAMQQKRDPDYERALHFLVKQYGPTLEKAMENEGSWQEVGRLLGVVVTAEQGGFVPPF
jgi:hypothetical protein